MKVYQENIKKYHAKIVRLDKVLNRISLLRLLIFLSSCIILITLFSKNLMTPFFIVFPLSILCFAFAVKLYDKTAYLRKHTSFLKSINESEILRGECVLKEFDTGDKFINQEHPYSSDLDIFGQHSIFQLVNRTTTESGMILLSEWLSAPALKNEIPDRQNAIKELSNKLGWRQDFQASGMHFQNKKSDYNQLLTWVEAPNVLFKNRIIYTVVALLLSILTLLSFYFFMNTLISSNRYIYLTLLIIVLFINYMILRKVRPIADNIVETAQTNLNICRGYQTLIHTIECENFKSKKLEQLKSLLSKNKYSAFREIKRLCKLLDFSQERGIKNRPISGNAFYSLFNSFFTFRYLFNSWNRKMEIEK